MIQNTSFHSLHTTPLSYSKLEQNAQLHLNLNESINNEKIPNSFQRQNEQFQNFRENSGSARLNRAHYHGFEPNTRQRHQPIKYCLSV